MNKKYKSHPIKSPPRPRLKTQGALKNLTVLSKSGQVQADLPVKEESKTHIAAPDSPERIHSGEIDSETFKTEVERFIEISKYFSSPLRKTASYLSEQRLISYPSTFRIEYKRGGITTEHIKFSNLVLEPVYLRLFKTVPEMEQLKYVNFSLSRCKRIPPGLSFTLGFVYDDVKDEAPSNAKMIFVASRKTTTPCYQVCEINLLFQALKMRRVIPPKNNLY